MMQFYKLQWETQRKRTAAALDDIDTLQRVNKRQRRENEHKDAVITALHGHIGDMAEHAEELQGEVNNLRLLNHALETSERISQRALTTSEQFNVELLSILQQIFLEDPHIKDLYTPAVQNAINNNMPVLEDLQQLQTDEVYDSDSTQPELI